MLLKKGSTVKYAGWLCWWLTVHRHFRSFQAWSVNLSTAFLVRLPVLSAYSFASNRISGRENGSRNFFMTRLHQRMLPDVRIELAIVRIQGGHVSNRATMPGSQVCRASCDRAWQNHQNDLHPAKTLISLGIHPVWSVFALHSVAKYPRLLQLDSEDWSNWADAYRSFCCFCHAQALCQCSDFSGNCSKGAWPK